MQARNDGRSFVPLDMPVGQNMAGGGYAIRQNVARTVVGGRAAVRHRQQCDPDRQEGPAFVDRHQSEPPAMLAAMLALAIGFLGVRRTRRVPFAPGKVGQRSEEHTSELQSLMRISYAVFCLK